LQKHFMQQSENIQKAIETLQGARGTVSALLSETPALQVRSNNVLDTLANGLGFTIGLMPTGEQQVFEIEPLTHFLKGSYPAGQAAAYPPAPAVNVTNEDVTDLRKRAEEAYRTFCERDHTAIMESLTGMEIRAVAKLAGLEVSEEEPKKIDGAFIDKIKSAIALKTDIENEKAQELAKQAEPKSQTQPSGKPKPGK
jgi:hypothetical protein